MKKRILTYVLAAAMTLSLAAPAAYGSQESAMTQSEAIRETLAESTSEKKWNTDIRLAIQRESAIRQEKGMSLKEWDETVAGKKQEGKNAPLTEEKILASNPDAQILEKDGTVYFVDGADALGDVPDAIEAYRAAYSAAALMGGNELADIRLWMQMDLDDIRIYSFQQISDSTMALGSTLKIAVRDGRVIAVFSSLDPEEGKKETLVTQDGAEDAVREKLENSGNVPEILTEYTDRIRYTPSVLADLNLDEMDDDPVPEEVRWIIYTRNEDEAFPFTAHYVDLAGNYLESLDVEAPGSDEALCGFRRQRIFEGMEADTWTGEVRGTGDEVRTVTLPVMRDQENRLYLGDVNRRIAVADFAKAVYDDSHPLELVQSDDGAVFDNEDLLMYYNYLNAWDFYADMGWIGPDGEGTDVIILKGLCTSDGTPYENACSIGLIQGWQMFGYTPYSFDGSPLGLGGCLDVMAHEYTHTFTSTVMNSNMYENDQGAINEAMSDIMGNLAEFILGETEDTRWLLGEKTGKAIRNMSDPAACQQPSYVWDKFYGPQTDIPNESNDRGGVHSNSSLLNYIAAKLCMDSGMSYEDSVRFWIMTASGLTPKTDYPQICALMRWAMRESGFEEKLDSLNRIIEEEHLDREEIPGKLPYDRKIVHLDLPDTEAFADEHWTMIVFQVNTDTIRNAAMTAIRLAIQTVKDRGDIEEIGRILSDFLNHIHLDGNRIELEKSDGVDEVLDAVKDTLVLALSRVLEQTMAWRSSADEDITYVTDDHPSFYMLLNIGKSGMKINGAAALIGDRWINLTPFLELGEEITELNAGSEETGEGQGSLLDVLVSFTREQWEALFDIAMAVRDVIHPDSEAEEETETEEGLPIGKILELVAAIADYAAADEAGKAEGLLFPAEIQELPVEGLEKVQLIDETEEQD